MELSETVKASFWSWLLAQRLFKAIGVAPCLLGSEPLYRFRCAGVAASCVPTCLLLGGWLRVSPELRDSQDPSTAVCHCVAMLSSSRGKVQRSVIGSEIVPKAQQSCTTDLHFFLVVRDKVYMYVYISHACHTGVCSNIIYIDGPT